MLLLTVRLWWRPGSSECEEKKSRNTATVWVCVKDGLVDGELSGQKNKKRGGGSFSASQETNRTQLLLHKPPHPAVRGPVCCCSWLL